MQLVYKPTLWIATICIILLTISIDSSVSGSTDFEDTDKTPTKCTGSSCTKNTHNPRNDEYENEHETHKYENESENENSSHNWSFHDQEDFMDDDGSAGQNNLEAIQEFLEWAEDEGVTFGPNKKIELVYQPGMGLSIIASEDIQPSEEPILSVPMALAFGDFNLKNTLMARALKSVPLAKKETKLAILLLSEMFDSESLWYPWFQLLPNRLDCTVFWSELEMAELESSNLVGETLTFNAIIREEYDKLNLPQMKKRHPQAFAGGIYSFSQFKWAFMIISSRGFSMMIDRAPRRILMPFVDFLNHNQNKSISFSYSRNNEEEAYSLDDMASRYSFDILPKDVSFEKGEQIFLFYKAHSNENLLLHYGFALENNINDVFIIKLNFKSQNYPQRELREHLIRLRGIDQFHKFQLQWKEPVIDKDLLFVVRVMGADSEQLKYLVREGVASDSLLEVESEIIVASHIRLSLERNLLAFSTTNEEDEETIKRLDKKLAVKYSRSVARQRSAVVFRIGQKKLLLHGIDWLFKYQEDLESRKFELNENSPYILDSKTVKPISSDDIEY